MGPALAECEGDRWTQLGGKRARLGTFFDPSLPAWFELALDPRTARPLELRMTAAAHFMQHRYTDFNRPVRIVPPRARSGAGEGTRTLTPPEETPDFKSGAYDQFRHPGGASIARGPAFPSS